VVLVVQHLKVFIGVVQDRLGPALDVEGGVGVGRAAELQLHLFKVVAVDVAVAAGPDEDAHVLVASLGHHLGSVAAVSNASGQVIEHMAYDPWGKRRNINGLGDPLDQLWVQTTDRGYTQHEHLDEVGVIHMNGRIYDPLNSAARYAAHAAAGCVSSVAGGGQCGQGAASAVFGKYTTNAIAGFGGDNVMGVIARGVATSVAGGVGSVIAGGSLLTGRRQRRMGISLIN
jgi:hypothetical protein